MRFIFDLDHTLVDSSHRSLTRADGSLDLEHWVDNCTPTQIMRDRPLPLLAQCRDLIDRHVEVIACTARVMGGADYQYLRGHGLLFDAILSRPLGDDTPDHLLKERLLSAYALECGESLYRFARRSILFDDNKNVLKHLTSLGFRCYDAISINERLAA
jgi:phosphoglycolate phosphatase-like HAD superfamily hydrolase